MMKVDREKLLGAIQRIGTVCNPKSKVHSNRMIRFRGGKIFASDGEIMVVGESPIDMDVSVNWEAMAKTLKSMAEAEIDLYPEEDSLRVEGETCEAKLLIEKQEYEIPDPGDEGISINPDDILEDLMFCANTLISGGDETMRGVLVYEDKLVGTDKVRISICDSTTLSKIRGFSLPRKLISLLSEWYEIIETIKFDVQSKELCRFSLRTTDDLFAHGTLISGWIPPDPKQFLPEKSPGFVLEKGNLLATVLKKHLSFAGSGKRTSIEFHEQNMKVSSRSEAFGQISDLIELPSKIPDDVGEVGITASLLNLDFLADSKFSVFPEDQMVTIEGENKTFLIRTWGEE